VVSLSPLLFLEMCWAPVTSDLCSDFLSVWQTEQDVLPMWTHN
jgi:hypothetical protein